MTPHERDEGYDFEGDRERNCRFGDPVVYSYRYKKRADDAATPKITRYELWERLTDALSGLPLTETQVNDLEAVFAEHFGIKIDNATAQRGFVEADGCKEDLL